VVRRTEREVVSVDDLLSFTSGIRFQNGAGIWDFALKIDIG
jgi:hypothetical protein